MLDRFVKSRYGVKHENHEREVRAITAVLESCGVGITEDRPQGTGNQKPEC